MLEIYKSSGRKPEIPPEIQQTLINELNEKEGLSSYKEIQTWLYTVHDLDVAYKVVHDTVRYRLKAKLKVPRRTNVNKDVEAEGIVEQRAIKQGIKGLAKREIIEGVEPGEKLATEGKNRLVNGAPVEIIP